MKSIVLLTLIFLSSSCVKLEVNPGNVVSDTVDAGKDLYKTIKLKSNGEEEREYSYSTLSMIESEDSEKVELCFSHIKSMVANESKRKPKYENYNSSVEVDGDKRSIKCSLTAVVKPK